MLVSRFSPSELCLPVAECCPSLTVLWQESKKVDTVELPPSKKVEADAKSDLKTLASSNGVSSKVRIYR